MHTLKVEQLSIEKIVPSFSARLCFELKGGECLTINGPSGLGKSMLLKAIADVLPHQGQIYLDDIPATQFSAPQWRRQVMLVPAESQWWYETVAEHFTHPEQVDFSVLGFDSEILTRDIHHLSSGEKQRLSILRALQYEPAVLLLDEPTANLDKTNSIIIESLIQNYISDGSHGVLWVSHDMQQLEKISQRMLKLSHASYEEIVWK